MKRLSVLVMAMLASFLASAQFTLTTDLSTGVVNNSTTPIAYDSPDDSWLVYRPVYGGPPYPQGLGTPTVEAYSGWVAPVNARWISAYNIVPFSPMNQQPPGVYEFRTTFQVTTSVCAVSSAVISFSSISSDNNITGMLVNGVAYTFTVGGFTVMTHNKTVTLNTADLVPGTNNLTLLVNNGQPSNTAPNYCALYAEGNVTINYKDTDPLTPSFFALDTYCSQDVISFAVSDGDGTAENYLWEVTECDASGTPTSSTPVYSSWFVGAPGNFTLPNSSSYPCGRYYLVKLVTTNSCTTWASVSHVIYIRCNPTPTITSSEPNPLCYGESTTLTTNYTPGPATGVFWSQGGITSSITVNPATNTTYSVSVIAKGCTGTASYTVTRYNTNNPAFTLSGSALSGNPYFTLSATPAINPGTNGISFYWDVVEINPSTGAEIPNTKVYNPSCWWGSNGITAFQNYNYTTSYVTGNNGYGNAANFGCSTTVGHFQSGHTYRITRATWTATCPWYAVAQTISMCTDCRLADTEVHVLKTEEFDAASVPESMQEFATEVATVQNQADQLDIFPNPSNGLFNMTFGNTSEKHIVVYDMMGKLVSEWTTSEESATLDLGNQPKGLFLCKVITAQGTETRRLLVQ